MFRPARRSILARPFCRVSLSRTYSTSPNQPIIDLLQRCLKEENSSPTRNAYKVRSFQVAIAAIHEHDKPICSGKEAIRIRGIGLGIANRIDFFLQGKEYDEESEKRARARLQAVETFEKIPGIGERTATDLVNAGAATVDDLSLPKYAELLSPSQKVSVRYCDHLTRPVTRSAAENITAFIRDHISSNFETNLMGAYRRDATDLLEVTLLLHHPQHIHVPRPSEPSSGSTSATTRVRTRGRLHMPFFQDVVRPLEGAGMLAAMLSSSPFRWRGIALLPKRLDDDDGTWEDVGDRLRDLRAVRGTYVRLDLSLAPLESRGAAQLALTGDDEFIRIARLAAARNGLYLNEYGLWRWHAPAEAALESHSYASSSSPATGSGYWELVEGESESRILDELALGAVPPSRRNFRFLATKTRASARAGTLDFDAVIGKPSQSRRRNHRSESEPESVAVGSPEDIDVDDVWVGTRNDA